MFSYVFEHKLASVVTVTVVTTGLVLGRSPFSHLSENAASYRCKCGTNGKPVCHFLLASNSDYTY